MDRIPALHRHLKALKDQSLQSGTIVSYTVIRNPPEGFGTQPYTVGLIKLKDGSTCCAQITSDGLTPEIGAVVEPCMRSIRTMENGLHVNGLKYTVIAQKSEPILRIQHYVLALSGPSGVGKTTITRSLFTLLRVKSEQVPIFTTSRVKSDASEPLVHVSVKRFDAMIESGDIIASNFLASERGRCGYRRSDIEKLWKEGKLPVVIADVQLLEELAAALGRRSVLSCGLLPPGTSRRRMLSALLHRLRSRGQETEQEIKERLQSAETELDAFSTHAHLFDHLLVNDQLEVCLETIEQIVRRP